jgi:hypothetical protein
MPARTGKVDHSSPLLLQIATRTDGR